MSLCGNSDHDGQQNPPAGSDAYNSRNSHVYVFKTNLDSNRNFSSFGDPKEVFTAKTWLTKIGLFAADFIGEGVELEAPVHVKVEGERSYAAILQTPPYHVDYIPVPWEADQTPKLTNFTYAPALKSTYTHKTEGSGFKVRHEKLC